MITKVGPSGNTIVARLFDLNRVKQRPHYSHLLDSFILSFRRIIGLRASENFLVKDLIDFVGHIPLITVHGPKADFLKELLPIRKMSSFPDGLGKHRYIALGD